MTALRFTLDTDRCTGCQACVLGCWMEHRAAQTRPWRRILAHNPLGRPGLPAFSLSLACHHCDRPACLEACPARAYSKDPATGAVVLDPGACMGCRYCTWACPFDAPRFSADLGRVEKCTFCHERLARGQEPACVARCPLDALGVEPRVGAAVLPPDFPGLGLGPGLRVAGTPTVPRIAPAPGEAPWEALLRVPERKITLRGEWTLVAFTTVLAVLTARMAAGAPFGHPGVILGAGLLALLLSAAHLGRPSRAWRAVLNVRTSWLSREVLLASLFLGLAALALAGLAPARAAAAAGFLALFAVDRVYRVALRTSPFNLHSGHALLNGIYLAALLAHAVPLALAAGAIKLALYLGRKVHFLRRGRPLRPLASLLRVAAGFLLPLAAHGIPGVLGAVAGDLVDRCEYYDELEIPVSGAGEAWGFRSSQL